MSSFGSVWLELFMGLVFGFVGIWLYRNASTIKDTNVKQMRKTAMFAMAIGLIGLGLGIDGIVSGTSQRTFVVANIQSTSSSHGGRQYYVTTTQGETFSATRKNTENISQGGSYTCKMNNPSRLFGGHFQMLGCKPSR